jgi:hypothetical protein
MNLKKAVLITVVTGAMGMGVLNAFASSKHNDSNDRDDATTTAFRMLTKGSTWELVDVIKMKFETFHTQGLVKIDDYFYVSAVENLEPRERIGETDALWDFSLDRTPGSGRGWLFKFDEHGNLLGEIELTEEAIFHPGGIDYDGKNLWVPVAEYRPNSNSIVYRVDPDTLAAEEVLRVPDHIGGIVHNTSTGTFHGVSWGSRRLYQWHLLGTVDGQAQVQSVTWTPNPQHYIDYQDCHSMGVDYMLCGGLNKYDTPVGVVAFGGIDLVDLRDNRPAHQIPVKTYVDDLDEANLDTFEPTDPELVASNNAFWAEPIREGEVTEDGIKIMRFYFMTERDNQADLLVYEVTAPALPIDFKHSTTSQ